MSIKELLKKKVKGNLSIGNDLRELEWLPTGIASLDAATGGGLPLRRMIHIFGPPSAGKSMLCLNIIRHTLEQDSALEALYIDCEGTVTKNDIEEMRLDGERTIFYTPTGGEDAYNTAIEALSNGVKIVVIDSVPFLKPQKVLDEVEKDVGSGEQMAVSKLMAKVQPALVNTLLHSDGVLVFINQERPSGTYEPPKYPGGSSITFLATLDIQIKVSRDKDDSSLITQKILMRKNKAFVPYLRCEIPSKDRIPLYGQCLVEAATEAGLIIKGGGGNYSVTPELATELGLEDPKLGRGLQKVGEFLEANKPAYDKLYAMVLETTRKSIKAIDDEFSEYE